MYRRKIEQVLYSWKTKKNHRPLIIKGVRQCGKTSSVLEFAKNNYEQVYYLDFRANPEYRMFFTPTLNAEDILLRMSATFPEKQIIDGSTCLIFDEIQDCPLARSALKYLSMDKRIDIICTGSLLGVNGYKTREQQKEEEQASIPVGYEEFVTMYPIDYEEWLWANGMQESHIDYLRLHLSEQMPIDAAIHNRFRTLLLQYVVVGGMPEAVTAFLQTKQIGAVWDVQQQIVESYKTDMMKYALPQDKSRIVECFNSIPAQLAKENKKFTYSLVRRGGRSSDYMGSLQWIEDAGIIKRCYNTSATELPLDGNSIREEFKVYLSDIGLLTSMLERGTQADILQGNLLGYKGAIFENLIADMFNKMGRKLYYFRKDSGLEIDFLIRYKGKCTPIEVKATTGNAKSLKTVMTNYDKYHVTQAIKLGDYNIGKEKNILTLPLYMTFLLNEV